MKSIFDWKNPRMFDCTNPICVWLNVFNVTLISMLAIIDLLSSVVVNSQIQGFLAIDDTRAVWIAKSFFFASALAPLFSNYAANKYGYKKLLFIGNTIFSIGAIGTGLSTGYYEMLFYRLLGGLGGGIALTVSLNIITITVPQNWRNFAVTAYANLFFGAGIAIGLLLGGYFGQLGTWRMVFLINLYFSLPTLLLTWILVPETTPIKQKPYDYFGFFCIALFFITLLFLVTQSKAPWNTLGWRSPFIHGCYLILLISFVAFILHSHRNDWALVDLKLFKHVRFCIGCAGLVVVGFMVFGVTIELMGILQSVYLYEYWMVGKFVSIVGVIYLIFGVITTALSHIVNPRLFILVGLCLIIVSCFLHQNVTFQSGPSQIGALIVLRSVGIGLVIGPLTALALSPFAAEDAYHAIAIITFFRQMAATFGSSLIAMIIAIRVPYHALRFGEQVNINSAGFRRYFHALQTHISESIGQGDPRGLRQTNRLITDQIVDQAEIASLNDAITILGVASLLIFCLVAGLMLYRFLKPYLLVAR